jgi:hypothetical protein
LRPFASSNASRELAPDRIDYEARIDDPAALAAASASKRGY